MDSIREWISDNLRYIILGVALIVVIILAVMGIRAITHIGEGGQKKAGKAETETETTANTDTIVDDGGAANAGSGTLVQNEPKVLTAMTSYYSARTNKDIATLKKLDPSIDEAQEQVNLESSYVESYSNIKTYSKEGPTEGSCVVYVCYDGKVRDIDTLVPSLTQFYLKLDSDGNYCIADPAGDAQAETFIDELRKTSEVQTLIDSVNSACEAAKNSDPVLKSFMDEYGNSQGSGDKEAETEENSGDDAAELVAIDACNVRSEPSTESNDNIIGGLVMGETVKKLGETDDGWTEIEFNGQSAYVKSELLSTQEDLGSAQDADYFSPEYTGGDAA